MLTRLFSPAFSEASPSGSYASSRTNDGLGHAHSPADGTQGSATESSGDHAWGEAQTALSYVCFVGKHSSFAPAVSVRTDDTPPPSTHDWQELQYLLATTAELRPSCQYLHQHPQQNGAFLTPHMRLIVVSWMVEVVEELGLHNTLHLAVALLDRFLSVTQDVPSGALQLMAVACILVAGKLHEARTPLVQRLTGIGANSFQACDLVRGERILLDALSFRLELPTANMFVHLFAQGQPNLHPVVLYTALFFTELALLDYSLLPYGPSCVAASALSLAMLCHGQEVPCHAFIHLSGCHPKELRQCAQELLRLHAAAAWPVSAEAKALLRPLRVKFGSEQYCMAAATTPLASLPFALFRG